MDHTRLHRLLKMLALIQSSEGWTAARLASTCGVDIRTTYRDLKSLEHARLGCRFDRRQRCYRPAEGVFLPPLQLSVEEALALAALCDQIGGKEQIPYLTPACRAITKLRGVLPVELRGEVDEMLRSVSIRTAASSDAREAADIYAKMTQAIRNRTVLLCRYDSPAMGDCGEFEFHPFSLLFCVRAWYVIGRHSRHGELRTLKLARFIRAAPTARAFPRPDGFTVDRYLGNAWRMMRGKDISVELWFDAEFAPTVSETVWHKSQQTQDHDDGSMTFRCTVSGLDEIVWWVLSMGHHCKVCRPAALASRVRELAQRTASLYRSAPSPRRSPTKKPPARRRGLSLKS